MRIMYDAVTPENIPRDAKMVAGYVNGNYPSYYKLAQLFPDAIHVSIAVSVDADAQVLDCERFDASPEECPAWAVRQRTRGQDPTVYMNASTWPAVRSAFVAQHVPEPHYWVANYDSVAEVPAGAVAKQYQGGMSNPYDVSAVADHWPGVDQEGSFLVSLSPEQENEVWYAAHDIKVGIAPGQQPFTEPGELTNRIRATDATVAKLEANVKLIMQHFNIQGAQ